MRILELAVAETEKYQILRKLFKTNDENFRAKQELLELNLPAEMFKLRGLKQRHAISIPRLRERLPERHATHKAILSDE